MLLVQVAQRVEDLERAATFYARLLGRAPFARFDRSGLVFFDLGGVRLLLERHAPRSLLYLQVADLAGQVRRLTAEGVEIVAPPREVYTDSGGLFGRPGVVESMAFVRDTEGNTVGLVERR